jgi:hypothetical protein
MKLPLRIKLSLHLKEKRTWIHGGDLERFGQSEGYEGETVKRRLREMTERGHRAFDPNIEEMYKDGAILYRYNPATSEKTASTKVIDYQVGKDCCYSFKAFGTHISECPIYAEMQKSASILVEETERNLRLI